MTKIIQALGALILLAASYYAGSRFGLPENVQGEIDGVIDEGIARTGQFGSRFFGDIERDAEVWLERFNDSAIYDGAGETEFETIIDPASAPIIEETVVPDPEIAGTNAPTSQTAPPPPSITADAASDLFLCLNRISNAPAADAENKVVGYTPTISVNGVALISLPATKSCLSSGFGPRGSSGKLHKGVDFFSDTGGDVLASADGTIVEALYRDDYGYMAVIDHGDGVYTRYAHLKRFGPGVTEGSNVAAGQVLGPIGDSGAYTSVVHLHYEILTGDFNTPKRSFGLTPVDPIAEFR